MSDEELIKSIRKGERKEHRKIYRGA